MSHTYRVSRKTEFGYDHHLTNFALANTKRECLAEFAAFQASQTELKAMIDYRNGTGCAYRLEFNFESSNVDQMDFLQAITHHYTLLNAFVENFIYPELRCVKTELFPKSLWTIHNFFFSLVEPLVEKKYLGEELSFGQLELLAVVERLMIVNLNGNYRRHLAGTGATRLQIQANIDRFCWPFFKRGRLLLDTLVLLDDPLEYTTADLDLVLFQYLPIQEKHIMMFSVRSSFDIDVLKNVFEDDPNLDQFMDEACRIWTRLIENWLSELGYYCLLKLQSLLAKKTRSANLVMLVSRLQALTQHSLVFPFVYNSGMAAPEISVTATAVLSSEIWDNLVISSTYTKISNLPQWFRTCFTISDFYQFVMGHAPQAVSRFKTIFETKLIAQELFISSNQRTIWTKIGVFTKVVLEKPHAIVIRQEPLRQGQQRGNAATFYSPTQAPSSLFDTMEEFRVANEAIWMDIYKSMQENVVSVARQYSFTYDNCPLIEGTASTEWEKYMILTCVVFSHLQIRINVLQGRTTRFKVISQASRKPIKHYYATMLLYFAQTLSLTSTTNPIGFKKRCENYCISKGHEKLIYGALEELASNYKIGLVCRDESIDQYIHTVWQLPHDVILEALTL